MRLIPTKLLQRAINDVQVLSARDHHILLLSTGYNGLTQRVHTHLADRGHDVDFRLAISPNRIRESVNTIKPDFVICPFLQHKIPEDVCQNHLCLVFHPGIPGDRGPHAIDWAILNREKTWGGILLQATEELDAGDIWASGNFPMTGKTKASIYRTDMTEVAVDCVNSFISKYDSLTVKTPEEFAAVTNKISDFEVQCMWRNPAKQNVRKISWLEDSTEEIIRKMQASDSAPGIVENFFGRKLVMYGCHKEGTLKGEARDILATREGAICLGTKDGAVWITHLRDAKGGDIPFKLPATQVLGEDHLRWLGIGESAYDPFKYEKTQTFRQVWYEEIGDVGILNFDFHNGAMSTEQCKLLMEAYMKAKQRHVEVLVLKGGKDFFSNGVHLNMIEASKNPAEESWKNINAINGIVREILTNKNQITVSAVEGNAGAGGVYLALASDVVIASEASVLNPHYKTMGLFGSEYHTYTAKKRVGLEKARLIKNHCLPISAKSAKKHKLIDEVIARDLDFGSEVLREASTLLESYEGKISRKVHLFNRSKTQLAMVICEGKELTRMFDNFSSDVYHHARKAFVHKMPATETPVHLVNLKVNSALSGIGTKGNILKGDRYAAEIRENLQDKIKSLQKEDPLFHPGLAIVQVGNRDDSRVYVNKKIQMAERIGINATHLQFPQETTQEELKIVMEQLNENEHIHGIMLQLPLDCTSSINTSDILDLIAPVKDVDSIGATNLGKILSGNLDGYLTCTPAACLELINKTGIMLQGKRAVVVGRSVVVGGTIAEILKWNNATVVSCHEHSENLRAEVASADILVVAVGIPNYIPGSLIKEGAVVIDCGINPLPDANKKSGMRIVGDVEFESAASRASFITPVPGGVGPMTVQMLMKNTVKAATAQHFKASATQAEKLAA